MTSYIILPAGFLFSVKSIQSKTASLGFGILNLVPPSADMVSVRRVRKRNNGLRCQADRLRVASESCSLFSSLLLYLSNTPTPALKRSSARATKQERDRSHVRHHVTTSTIDSLPSQRRHQHYHQHASHGKYDVTYISLQ